MRRRMRAIAVFTLFFAGMTAPTPLVRAAASRESLRKPREIYDARLADWRTHQVVYQVFGIFETCRQADEAVRYTRRPASFRGDSLVRHLCRMGYEALYSAEAFRQLPQFRRCQQPGSRPGGIIV